MAAPRLQWSKPKHRVISSGLSANFIANGSDPYRFTKRRTQELWAQDEREFQIRGFVRSNGLRQIEAIFYCAGVHGCPSSVNPYPFFKTFASAMCWVQWQYEMCCARQVEQLLLRLPNADAPDVDSDR